MLLETYHHEHPVVAWNLPATYPYNPCKVVTFMVRNIWWHGGTYAILVKKKCQ
jgi:hypothetical protein